MELFSSTVSIFIVPPLVSLIFSVILIFVVLGRDRLKEENSLFALVCFIWMLLYFVFISHHLVQDERIILKIERTVHFFFVYVGAVSVIFIHRITGTKRKNLEFVMLACTFFISLSTQTEHYFTGLYKYSWGYIARGGVFFNIFSVMSSIMTIYCIVISYRCFRREKNEIKRLKVKYIFTGFVLTAFMALFNVPAINGIDLYPIGNYSFIPLTIMAYGLLRYKLIDVNQLLLKSIVWLISLIMVSLPIGFFAFMLAVQKVPFNPVPSAIFLMMSGLFVILYTRYVQPRIESALQSRAFDYRKLADEFTAQLIRLKSMDELIAAIFSMLTSTINPSHITYIYRQENGTSFTTFADYKATCTGEWVIPPEDQALMTRRQGVLEKEQIELNPKFKELRDIMARYFLACECIAAIPVLFEGRMLGAINIGRKEKGAYSRLDVEFLEMLVPGINTAISNSILLRKYQDLNLLLEEKVRERTALLNESEQKYRNLIENANDIILTCDTRGRITFVNTLGLALLGYSREEIQSMNVFDLVHPDLQADLRAYYDRQYAERIPEQYREYTIQTKGGDSIWISQKTRLIMEGSRVTGYYSISRNITQQKKAEEALRDSEEKYRHIVDNATDAIYTLDSRGYFTFGNRATSRHTGYGMEELCAMRFLDIIAREHRKHVIDYIEKQLRENSGDFYLEFQFTRKDGVVLWAGQTTRAVKLKDGTVIYHSIARDISEKKKADDERRELEEHKTLFFSNISHEIRTPLTLILSPVESYLQGDYDGEPERPFFENLYRNGLRLLKLINNLLDFSKIEAGKMNLNIREMNIAAILESYIASMRSTAEIRGITIDFYADVRYVANLYVDLDKVDRIFMNLLSNALKFTDRGGSIQVRLREDEVFCYIEIEDTGCGIPADRIGGIFERFSQADTSATRKHEGTGIGLSLAKELVEMHGGTIIVKSRYISEHPEDHGSLFSVTLLKGRLHFSGMDNVIFESCEDFEAPEAQHRYVGMREMIDLKGAAIIPESPSLVNEEPIAENRKIVLIADDNDDMRVFLTGLLEKEYLVMTAENGSLALEKALSHRPDIVITDIMMPVMDGHELTRLMKGNPMLAHIPLIMLTAKAELFNKVKGFEHGADDYLTKPFNSKELLARVATLLRSSEYQRVIARRNIEIEQQLDMARLILNKLLPQEIPDAMGYLYSVTCIPMDKVGGDFFDFFQRDGALHLFIADVSGHGLHAAFLALITKMALDGVADRSSPASVIKTVNEVVCRSTVKYNFVTAFCGVLDTESRVLRYSNAGHFLPLVYRKHNREFVELTARGKPMGWFKSFDIEEREIQLRSGDRLVLYTDGITECACNGGDLFGEERLRDIIGLNADLNPTSFSERLMDELTSYRGSTLFNDDLTLIVIDLE